MIETGLRLPDGIPEIFLVDLADFLIRFDLGSQGHVQPDKPASAQGTYLGEPVAVDQQDPLADNLLGDPVEKREQNRPGTDREQCSQRDPGMECRHPHERIEPFHRDSRHVHRGPR